MIDDMLDYIDASNDQNNRINGVLISRNDVLVLEKYYNGYDQDAVHATASVMKSVVSLLVGIAIDQGFIQGEDVEIFDFFTGQTFENMDARKDSLTIRHLLTMTSGLQKGDYWTGDLWSDWIQSILDEPVITEPGQVFQYHGGNVYVLMEILMVATGMDLLAFADQYLFTPLGINSQNVAWKDAQDRYEEGAMRLLPGDMMKIGLLFLNRGLWNGVRVVSESWVDRSTDSSMQNVTYSQLTVDYGFLWWVDVGDYAGGYFAMGYGGQYIYVYPPLNLVVVTTAGLSQIETMLNAVIKGYIIPSISDPLV
jgi:CubicO group peptidase (beta-lactamase class C family)